ncbi:excitatory amino acid transporter 3-like [Ornithodoros turicata]|uniref:excitatory amino acid transporter 3-like n=1 Tax=Ornithodoros turicata TaxID=34597 RepID=UPI003139A2B7
MDTRQTSRKEQVMDLIRTSLRTNLQLTLSIVAIVLGVIIGYTVGIAEPSDDAVTLISVPGEILLRMYKMLTLPLVVSSVISAMARVQLRTAGQMFLRMIFYYVFSTFAAAVIGIIMVSIFRPGEQIMERDVSKVDVSALDSFLDFITNFFPENLIRAFFQLHRTVRSLVPPKVVPVNGTDANFTDQLVVERHKEFSDGMNIFGTVVFCSVFGLAAGHLGETCEVMVEFFSLLNVLCMKLAYIVMWYFPIGVIFLLSSAIIRGDELGEHVGHVGIYIATVMTGLAFHSMVILPTMYYAMVRKNPLMFAKDLLHAFVTAFGTSDSVATLPVTYMCLEQKNKLDKRVTRFVMPIASAFNLDGTALYVAIGTVFLANLSGVPVDFAHYLAVCVSATLTSFALRGIPNAGVITVILVLKAGGVGPTNIGLLLAVDWIMNRCRTVVNVFSQAIATAIVHTYVEGELRKRQDVLADWGEDETCLTRRKYSVR